MTDDETWVEGDHANTLNSFDAGDVRTTHAIIAHGVSASDDKVAGTLCTNSQGGQRTTDIAGAYVTQTFSVYPEGGNGADITATEVNCSPALMKTKSERGVHITQAYNIREDNASNTFSATPIDAARCLQKHQPSVQSHHAQTFIAETFPINDGREIEKEMNGTGIGDAGAPAYTLDRQQRPAVAQPETMSVRRLTPVECERLMGWQDRHTAPEGVKAPDSKRYAACGDGIVAPVAFWIADRIRMIEDES